MTFEEQERRQAVLAAIIDSSEDAIISKNLNSIIMSWNKSAERMFGYTEEEAIGKHIFLIMPEEFRSEEEMIISRLKQGKKIEHFQTIRKAKSGKRIHISLTISPIRDSTGTIIGASKIARDISLQIENEKVIGQYTKQLESINLTGKSIAAQLDVPTILQIVTDAATQLSGAAFGAFFYNKIDSNGDTYMLYSLSGAPKEAFEKFGMPRNTAIFKKTFAGEGTFRSDDITKDPLYGKNAPHKGMPMGHLPVVSYLAVPVFSKNGVVLGGLFFGHPEPGVFTDLHEDLVEALASQASIALDNAKLYDEVKSLNERKDEFIAFASHELKTPLTTMLGYIELANQNPELLDSYLPKVGKQAQRLQSLIADLLDISMLQAGKWEFNFSKTSLKSIIKESIESLNLENHILKIEEPGEDILINVDRQKIIQVVTNVLSNAVKYSFKGSEISLVTFLQGDEIEISVKDNGMGIAPEFLDKIFSQFYRVSKSSNKATGMGLGLFISKHIVDQHMGKIWAESEEGKGSTFYIKLPVNRI
jgi:PAS domain S-box-containing protein